MHQQYWRYIYIYISAWFDYTCAPCTLLHLLQQKGLLCFGKTRISSEELLLMQLDL